MPTKLPRLYAIVDAARIPAGMTVAGFAAELMAGGAAPIQYRNKSQIGKTLLADAEGMRRAAASHPNITLIMNDRADLCLVAGFQGVHLGQDDLSPTAARVLCKPPLLIGVSTHNAEQVQAADRQPVDYIAIGPVFATASKANPDPVIGVEGVRAACKLTSKPLVAIGGITRANCREVMDAGADCVAVISELLNDPRKTTEAFLRVLG